MPAVEGALLLLSLALAGCGAGAHGQGSTDTGAVCGSSKPGPTNTGVPPGTTLAPSGSLEVTADGATVENLDITGSITVLANNVTIRKVRITTDDYYPVRYFDNDNTGLVVEDSEIVGLSGNVTSAVAFQHYTARRLNVHGSADGLKADADVLIEDCWIHDSVKWPGRAQRRRAVDGGQGSDPHPQQHLGGEQRRGADRG